MEKKTLQVKGERKGEGEGVGRKQMKISFLSKSTIYMFATITILLFDCDLTKGLFYYY